MSHKRNLMQRNWTALSHLKIAPQLNSSRRRLSLELSLLIMPVAVNLYAAFP